MAAAKRSFSLAEVAKHNSEGDLWVAIDSHVYDLSKFVNFHPGGKSVLYDEEIAGKDATEQFFSLHRTEVLHRPAYKRLIIGTVEGQSQQFAPAPPGSISRVPYADPSWLDPAYSSVYFKDSHRRLQRAFRVFCDEAMIFLSVYLIPDALLREEDGKPPSPSLLEKMGELNIHAMRLGPGKHLKGLKLMGGIVEPEEYDYFHELVITQEIGRHGTRGYGDGLSGGLPPVINFGSRELQAKVVPEVFSGKKQICLAISEAFAGSDVSGVRTTAKKTPDGKHFIVNGTKKWITNGTFSDYFTVACKTDKGLTVLLIERQPGVETKAIKTSYSSTAGTAYITFDNVKVPVGERLGKRKPGVRSHRNIVGQCLVWANQRKVFGKPLMNQPVVRAKLANMIARVESGQSWLENITLQMCNMSYKAQAEHLAGPLALLKMYVTRAAQESAAEAVQIFGGRAITKTGLGQTIENFHRAIPFDAVLGGAEDVLGDLGVRQAAKKIPKNARL
ncbi:hypothetical protein BS47DRAFT_1372631 [Hydnum rufescens UP504]|uniref:Cytochrome b5 heme-binding domain-containing protein n=1 Tax=Hydnum rufescens UP504 TaxID=1448309 RepID=A0A9P6DSE1_9AGAM|nr:hypothetical protein BS47DRAFT_1372631 [Hydnum rufescens UP504]